jgi:two-component system, NtrC family, response regulator HydG
VKVLVLANDSVTLSALRAALPGAHELVATAEAAVEALARRDVDLAVVDHALAQRAAAALLEAAGGRAPEVPVVILGNGAISSPLDSVFQGAFQVLAEPLEEEHLSASLRRALEARWGRALPPQGLPGTAPPSDEPVVIGSSPPFMATLERIDRMASSDAPGLLLGETGVGKDLLAARMHARGSRRHRRFVSVRAAAVPPATLDAALFGAGEGVSTGGTAMRGLFREADGGTLFVDEITDVPLAVQARLLCAIERGEIHPGCAGRPLSIDVRFVAASRRDLASAVRDGHLREDLYFRLSDLAVRVPSLRHRRKDISALAEHFLAKARSKVPHAPVESLSSGSLTVLENAPWPGNVRELAARMERMVVFGEHAAFAENVTNSEPVRTAPAFEEMSTLRNLTESYVAWVLERSDGDKARAAAVLGVDVSTLYRWKRRKR